MFKTIILLIAEALLLIVLGLWLIGEYRLPMRSSSWKLLRQADWQRFFDLSVLHAYIYGRWTNQYIDLLIHGIFPRIGVSGKKWWSEHYHGKVIIIDQARAIINVNQDIPLRDLEQIIPYSMARNLVLTAAPDVAVFECGCRHSRTNPCQPTQVCMVIGQPFVDFIIEHKPGKSRRLTQTEALELLQAEHERGHLHSAWFKDVLLNRFYAICNCCKCCCGGVEAMM